MNPSYSQANSVLRDNLSARYKKLDRLERYVEGSQYEHMCNWHEADKPLHERAPCFVYPIAECAITSVSEMCFGEGGFPDVTVNTTKTVNGLFALNESEGVALDYLIDSIVESGQLNSVASDALESAMGQSTSVAVLGVADGRFRVELVKAKWCTAQRDPRRPTEITQLEIKYPYIEEYKPKGSTITEYRCMLYRRVIDSESDTTYLPAKASQSGEEPDAWVVDANKYVEHGFGFCPVVWYAYRKRCGAITNYDGHAIHEKLTDEMDCLNYGLSQKHSASLVAASPPTVETGVDRNHDPSPGGRTARIIIPHEYNEQGNASSGIADRPSASKPATPRGPGVMWRYPHPETRVEMLTLPGDALKPVEDACRDERSKIAESMGVVFVDPDNAKFSAELSGKALARLFARQIRLCSKVRIDFADNFIVPVIGMALRICSIVGSTGKLMLLDGFDEALGVLQKFTVRIADDPRWIAPPMHVAWGPYFAPDADDDSKIVSYTTAARKAGLITQYTAIQELTDVFEIDNIDTYLVGLQAENELAEQKAMEIANANAMQKL